MWEWENKSSTYCSVYIWWDWDMLGWAYENWYFKGKFVWNVMNAWAK